MPLHYKLCFTGISLASAHYVRFTHIFPDTFKNAWKYVKAYVITNHVCRITTVRASCSTPYILGFFSQKIPHFLPVGRVSLLVICAESLCNMPTPTIKKPLSYFFRFCV